MPNLFIKQVEERDKIRAIYFFLATSFNKLNNTGARMLDSIYHMTLKLF